MRDLAPGAVYDLARDALLLAKSDAVPDDNR
jgi:hypothetical protein